ncbi:PH domain-containing protein [Nocardia aurantia]|uniref:Low molecular weight protein antigen 6 PH domain-containing protein n=1 Tax=Nocardia aurantia TaxID=2585199 RepID=A0A7K0DV53_9NOCA|nr:PH domain-containing protein [Nocardia aurantia]MQY29629.1 hypothetical protein [Nocardia aurantia]
MPRLGHLGVFVLLFCVAFAFFGWPRVLWILFVIPIGVSLWIERSRTTVSASGLDLRTLFGSRHVEWERIRGLRIPTRGWVRAHLDDDSEVGLPAVDYGRLRDLVEASGGRIPDPFAQPDEPDDHGDGISGSAAGDSAAAGTATGARSEVPADDSERAGEYADDSERADVPADDSERADEPADDSERPGTAGGTDSH